MKNQTVMARDYAMNPKTRIPRTAFPIRKGIKKTFDAGLLVPILMEEVIPGDTISVNMTAILRMSTPIVPIMDNIYATTFFFFGPERLVWDNARKMYGEQDNPGDSTSYTTPQTVSPAGGFAIGSFYDHIGIGATVGQVQAGQTVSVSTIPGRLHNLCFNQWFRDQNLVNSQSVPKNDGPDTYSNYVLYNRGKRFDMITQALPFLQKGNPVTLPLAGQIPVKTSSSRLVTTAQPGLMLEDNATAPLVNQHLMVTNAATGNANVKWSTTAAVAGAGGVLYPSNLYADAGLVSLMNINDLRLANATQEYLERDARYGTRYTEYVYGHFGVQSPDQRLQRIEYLGGGSTLINFSPVEQQSGTGASGTTTPAGYLSAYATGVLRNGFSQSFTEHGYVFGYICVDADLTYQQGIPKRYTRLTKFDRYVPTLANLGEQPIYNREIYARGDANDSLVFGYIPRWDELRSWQSEIHGLYRSTAAGTIDYWHLSQKFTALPTLNQAFMTSSPPLSRILAGGAAANGQQFLADILYTGKMVRSVPMFSRPQLMSRF